MSQDVELAVKGGHFGGLVPVIPQEALCSYLESWNPILTNECTLIAQTGFAGLSYNQSLNGLARAGS